MSYGRNNIMETLCENKDFKYFSMAIFLKFLFFISKYILFNKSVK